MEDINKCNTFQTNDNFDIHGIDDNKQSYRIFLYLYIVYGFDNNNLQINQSGIIFQQEYLELKNMAAIRDTSNKFLCSLLQNPLSQFLL